MPVVRTAEVEWIGGFTDGEGRVLSTSSAVIPELEMTWAARVDEDHPQATPEELIAAAHAMDFAMQFTSGLVGSGWEPEEMQVTCAVSSEVGLGIIESALTARVTVDGLTDEQIYEIAQRAKIMCPVSRALAGIDVTLDLPDLVLESEEDEEGAEGEVPAATEE